MWRDRFNRYLETGIGGRSQSEPGGLLSMGLQRDTTEHVQLTECCG